MHRLYRRPARARSTPRASPPSSPSAPPTSARRARDGGPAGGPGTAAGHRRDARRRGGVPPRRRRDARRSPTPPPSSPRPRSCSAVDAQGEISTSQLEVATPVSTSLAEVRGAARAAAPRAPTRPRSAHGCRILAAGTHPTGHLARPAAEPGRRATPRSTSGSACSRCSSSSPAATCTSSVPDPRARVQVLDRLRPGPAGAAGAVGELAVLGGHRHRLRQLPHACGSPASRSPARQEVLRTRSAYDAPGRATSSPPASSTTPRTCTGTPAPRCSTRRSSCGSPTPARTLDDVGAAGRAGPLARARRRRRGRRRDGRSPSRARSWSGPPAGARPAAGSRADLLDLRARASAGLPATSCAACSPGCATTSRTRASGTRCPPWPSRRWRAARSAAEQRRVATATGDLTAVTRLLVAQAVGKG